jgi:hypothetical protein
MCPRRVRRERVSAPCRGYRTDTCRDICLACAVAASSRCCTASVAYADASIVVAAFSIATRGDSTNGRGNNGLRTTRDSSGTSRFSCRSARGCGCSH